MISLESARTARNSLYIFRSNVLPIFRSSFSPFFCSTVTFVFCSSIKHLLKHHKWTKVELPLMPKVAFVHKILKSALDECEYEIPEFYIKKLRDNLTEIRAVNWNAYNTKGMCFYETQKVKKLLENLKECEQDLPKPLAKKLENFCVFGSLQDAIDCLDDRSGQPPQSLSFNNSVKFAPDHA